MVRRIEISKEKIKDFCRDNHIRSMALFGSVLREDFGPDSDIDIMVEFEEDKGPSLFGLIDMQEKLSEILAHKVDLVERKCIERSENYIRKRHILESLETIYVAR